MRRTPSPLAPAAAFAALAAVWATANLAAPAASADRRAAEALLPADSSRPLFQVTLTGTLSGDWEDLPRLPEVVLYPDGTFLVQKTDERLWAGRLAREQVLDFLDFLVSEVRFPEVDMTYLVAAPIATFREYRLQTREGRHEARRRVSGGFGAGVRDGERALRRVDQRLLSMGDLAARPYTPAATFVVSRPTGAAAPEWAWSEALPFAALVDATGTERRRGAVLAGAQAAAMGQALARSPAWRFGPLAAEFRARPALPHETGVALVPAPPPSAVATLGAGTPPSGSASAAPAPVPFGAPAGVPPPVTPGPLRSLVLVGSDVIPLGPAAAAPDPGGTPALFVARDAAAWARVFDALLPARGGLWASCATILRPVRDAGTAYDFASGPLLLLTSPVTDDYAWVGVPIVETPPEGAPRVLVTYRHDARPAGAPPADRFVRWGLYRAEGPLPGPVGLRANGRDAAAVE